MKNIDEWVEWMTRNPELAEKHYPKLMQGLTERIKNSEPFLTALIIQKLPEHFPNWKTEAEKHLGIKKIKMIQGYIDLIKTVLIEYEYPSEIEQQAVESVRAELAEQLEYWEREIKPLPPQQTETKTNKLKAPVLGLFCSLINKIGIDKKDETESATVYCERICNKFKLPYTERVRQNYNVNETKKLIQELTEKVLPLIDNKTKNLVEKYLDSKQLPKQNLYG